MTATWALRLAGPVLAGSLAAVAAPAGTPASWRALFAVGVAAATLLSGVVYRFAAPRLGAVTAWGVLALLFAALFGAVFALAPDCYASAAPARCESRDVITWAVAGALVPATVMALTWLPAQAARRLWGLGRWVTSWPTRGLPGRRRVQPAREGSSTVDRKAARSGNPAVRASADRD